MDLVMVNAVDSSLGLKSSRVPLRSLSIYIFHYICNLEIMRFANDYGNVLYIMVVNWMIQQRN